MNSTNAFLYYNTPLDQFKTYYPNVQDQPFRSESYTQLPKNIAIIRSVAAVAYASLLALSIASPIVSCSIGIAGATFASWTIYSHLYAKDELMEAFYTILGGKENFDKLPEIELEQCVNKKISESIKLEWKSIKHPISKTKTLDGRNVIVVKALTRNKDRCPVYSVLTYVEKLGPIDLEKSKTFEIFWSIGHAIGYPFTGNTFTSFRSCSGGFSRSIGEPLRDQYSCNHGIYSSISSNMANELFAQLNNVS